MVYPKLRSLKIEGLKMVYDIKINEYQKDVRGFKIGNVDFTAKDNENDITHIFRDVAFFVKDNKRWLSSGKTKRGDRWFSKYERIPSEENKIFEEALKLLEERI